MLGNGNRVTISNLTLYSNVLHSIRVWTVTTFYCHDIRLSLHRVSREAANICENSNRTNSQPQPQPRPPRPPRFRSSARPCNLAFPPSPCSPLPLSTEVVYIRWALGCGNTWGFTQPRAHLKARLCNSVVEAPSSRQDGKALKRTMARERGGAELRGHLRNRDKHVEYNNTLPPPLQ